MRPVHRVRWPAFFAVKHRDGTPAARAGMKAVAMTTSLTAREFQGHPAVIRIGADYTSLRPQDLLRMARPPKPT